MSKYANEIASLDDDFRKIVATCIILQDNLDTMDRLNRYRRRIKVLVKWATCEIALFVLQPKGADRG